MSRVDPAQQAGADEDPYWRLIDAALEAINDGEVGLPPESEFRDLMQTLIREGVGPAWMTDQISACADEVYRYGPLTALMQAGDVTDIVVNGPDEILVDRGRGLYPDTARFRSADHLYAFAARRLGRAGRTVNRASPLAEVDMEDGSRLHVVAPPISGACVKLSIRKFRASMRLETIVESGMISVEDANFLRDAVRARKNIIVAGGPGAGKTTLMGALLDEVDPSQRIVGIEDVPELRPDRAQYVRLLTRRSNGPFMEETSVRDLVREALRMRPDRLVVGEVRGSEALDMVTAMSTGMAGSMTTLHANSAASALDRLEVLLHMASGSARSVELGRRAVDLVIFIRRLEDGRRVVESIERLG
jgi:pilus assembly protein CpaF